MRTRYRVHACLGQAQPLHGPPVHHMLLDDLSHIFRPYKPVPDRFRVDHERGPVLALVQAGRLVGPYRRLQAGGADRLLEQLLKFAFTIRGAAATGTPRLPLIRADEQMSLKTRQCFAPLPQSTEPDYGKRRDRFSSGDACRQPPPSARMGLEMMPPDNLHSLKDDMIAFIEGHGMRRLPGFVMEDVASVLWEDEQNPDSWKDFVEMAKAAQAPFITMSDITLEKEDLKSLLEDLRDFNFPDDVPDSEDAEYLVNYVGKTGFVQLGFAHQGIMFLHESSTEWYDRYQQLLESLESVGDIVINEDADEE